MYIVLHCCSLRKCIISNEPVHLLFFSSVNFTHKALRRLAGATFSMSDQVWFRFLSANNASVSETFKMLWFRHTYWLSLRRYIIIFSQDTQQLLPLHYRWSCWMIIMKQKHFDQTSHNTWWFKEGHWNENYAMTSFNFQTFNRCLKYYLCLQKMRYGEKKKFAPIWKVWWVYQKAERGYFVANLAVFRYQS